MTDGPFSRNLLQTNAVNALDPHVLVDIMRTIMKSLAPALLVVLGARSTVLTAGCGGSFRPQISEEDAQNREARIVKAGVVSDSEQMQRLKEQKVTQPTVTDAPG